MAKKVLGKGLGAIISMSPTPAEAVEEEILSNMSGAVHEIDLEKIFPNPDQPRLFFDEKEIEGLAESIRSVGLIQPIIVRRDADRYLIVAGERRFRAMKHLEKSKIKAIVVEANEEENVTLALIENIQRQNLDPIEEAKAYKVLINRFKLKQNDVAAKVGKERATVANMLRLLSLPDEIQDAISAGTITMGHAKVLLSLEADEINFYYRAIIEKGLSVRGLERLIADNKDKGVELKSEKKSTQKEAHLKQMEEKLVSMLGTKVEIKHSGSKGKIEISYYSLDDFERIVEKFT